VTTSGDGRIRLLDAAELLFDSAGIDGASGAAIVTAAGHKNAAAVNYHFGNLDGLVLAVLTRRAEQLDVVRHALLDELEADGQVEPRAAFVAMVEPLAALLDEPEGRRYLRLLNQAANHPRFHAEADWRFATSVERGAVHLAPLVAHLPAEVQGHRAGNVLGLVLYALAEQARRTDGATSAVALLDRATFVEDLADTTVAALRA